LIIAIITAAGESKRFPGNKLLYKYREKPLIIQTIENIIECNCIDHVIVVTGHMHEEISSVIREHGLNVEITYNPDYTVGMSTSIKHGVKYVLKHYNGFKGVMINPGDCAWIHPGIYSLLTVRFYEFLESKDIVVASYMGRRGHPIIFSYRLIPSLLEISEERKGLKEVTLKYLDRTLVVETNYPGVVLDLDTILDVLRVKTHCLSRCIVLRVLLVQYLSRRFSL